MKKLFLLLSVTFLSFSLVACGSADNPTDDNDTDNGDNGDNGDSDVNDELNIASFDAITGSETGSIEISAELADGEHGDIYYIVVDGNSARPNADEVVAGEDYGSVVIEDTGHDHDSLSKTVLSLEEGTNYSVFFAAKEGDVLSEVEKAEAIAKVDDDTRTEKVVVDCATNTTDIDGISYYNLCDETDLSSVGIGDYTRNGEVITYSMSANYIIGANIDLSSIANWNTTILGGTFETGATKHSGFKGIFDGNGYTISNLTLSGEPTTGDGGLGMFAYVGETSGKGTIRNIIADNFSITVTGAGKDKGGFGAIVGRFRGELIENIRVYNSSVENTVNSEPRLGGVVGRFSNGTATVITGSKLFVDENTVITGQKATGGVIGYLGYDSDSDLNTVLKDLESHAIVNGTENVGGVVGASYGGQLSRLISYANVSGIDNVGSVVGTASTGSKFAGTKNVVSHIISVGGTVDASTSGGFVIGSLSSDAKYEPSNIYGVDGVVVTIAGTIQEPTDTNDTSKNGMKLSVEDFTNTSNEIYNEFDFISIWKLENDKITLKGFFKGQ